MKKNNNRYLLIKNIYFQEAERKKFQVEVYYIFYMIFKKEGYIHIFEGLKKNSYQDISSKYFVKTGISFLIEQQIMLNYKI